jgi:hypothetical protein
MRERLQKYTGNLAIFHTALTYFIGCAAEFVANGDTGVKRSKRHRAISSIS